MSDTALNVGWPEFWAQIVDLATFVQNGLLELILQPWGQIQIALLLVLFGASHLAAKRTEPPFETWVRNLETTRQRLRVFAILLRRLRLVFFVAASWLALLVMRATTWPSRSYLIGMVAAIASVWLAISLISRLVKNRLAARALTATVVVLAALQILGLIDFVTAILDTAAISAGDFRLSLLTIVKSALVLAALLTFAQIVSSFTEKRVQKLEDLSPSIKVLTGKLVRIGLFTLAIMLGLQTLGLDLTTLTVFSGAIGLGLGFGLQKVVSNLVSGVILLLDRSVKPGDVIEVGNTFGWIAKLGARFVSVVTRDGREYLIPNEDLITSQVVNWSYTNTRVRLEVSFGVSYDADPLTVRKLAIEAAKEPKRVLAVPAPVCHLTSFGDSSVDYLLRFWVSDPSAGVVNIRSEVMIALWYALKQNGISIPFPQRDLDVKNPLRVVLERPEAVEAKSPPRRPRKSTTKEE